MRNCIKSDGLERIAESTRKTASSTETPPGWVLLLTDAEGNVLGDIEIGGYDLGKDMARGFLSSEIMHYLDMQVRERT